VVLILLVLLVYQYKSTSSDTKDAVAGHRPVTAAHAKPAGIPNLLLNAVPNLLLTERLWVLSACVSQKKKSCVVALEGRVCGRARACLGLHVARL
jgi:hypothetical protein